MTNKSDPIVLARNLAKTALDGGGRIAMTVSLLKVLTGPSPAGASESIATLHKVMNKHQHLGYTEFLQAVYEELHPL